MYGSGRGGGRSCYSRSFLLTLLSSSFKRKIIKLHWLVCRQAVTSCSHDRFSCSCGCNENPANENPASSKCVVCS